MFQIAQDSSNASLIQWAFIKGIQWHFSPGRAPHFGGLREAAVRSMKTLLRKTMGEHVLRWDELLTVGLVRVVDVMSKGKTYRRPIAKLIKLLGEEVLDTSFPKGEDVQANGQDSTT